MGKKLFLISMLVVSIVTFNGCTKVVDTEAINKKAAVEFIEEIKLSQYRLVDFYSDLPIDYIQDDNIVKSETDLKAYIKPYLLDDINEFDEAGNLSIIQGAVKIPGDNSPIINRAFGVSWDKKYTYINFVDYYYAPYQYKLKEFTSSGFVLYLNWHTGAKVYSRFTKI